MIDSHSVRSISSVFGGKLVLLNDGGVAPITLWHNGETYTESEMVVHAGWLLQFGTDVKGILGWAYIGNMCSQWASMSLSRDSGGALYAAGTVTHEIGHSVGFGHCDCEKRPCVMEGVHYGGHKSWSNCAKNKYQSLLDLDLLPCLYNYPSVIYGKSVCGNGLVQAGEQCDCGSEDDCHHLGLLDCCDPYTCKLRAHAQCAQGECCEKCKFKKKGVGCRSPLHTVCHVEEKCTGRSEHCPANDQTNMAHQPVIWKGCYELKKDANRTYLLSGRQGLKGKWKGSAFANYIRQFVCKCASAARRANAKYFGIHFWAECWIVKQEDLVATPDGECFLADGKWRGYGRGLKHRCKGISPDDRKKYECTATANNYFMYEVKEEKEIEIPVADDDKVERFVDDLANIIDKIL